MESKQWYVQLFENYADTYEKESFVQGTVQEVEFLHKEFGSAPSEILDIGCGTGRHSIALAEKGHSVTGVDLSTNMLAKAKEKAQSANLSIDFKQADACSLNLERQFDHAIMLCEGGFSLMETDLKNFKIIENAGKHLRPGGKFIFTCLNAFFPLKNSIGDFLNNVDNSFTTQESNFQLSTFREISKCVFNDDDGNPLHLDCNERYYTPSELNMMLEIAGFSKVEVFGCNVGDFKRGLEPSTDTFELLCIATAAECN